jgi:hypothetical protein
MRNRKYDRGESIGKNGLKTEALQKASADLDAESEARGS